MWGGGGMWVRSDVTSGRNRRWEWRPDAGDAEDGKTTSDASGRGARASDAGLIFADVSHPSYIEAVQGEDGLRMPGDRLLFQKILWLQGQHCR